MSMPEHDVRRRASDANWRTLAAAECASSHLLEARRATSSLAALRRDMFGGVAAVARQLVRAGCQVLVEASRGAFLAAAAALYARGKDAREASAVARVWQVSRLVLAPRAPLANIEATDAFEGVGLVLPIENDMRPVSVSRKK